MRFEEEAEEADRHPNPTSRVLRKEEQEQQPCDVLLEV
jgi:hypothetical protein